MAQINSLSRINHIIRKQPRIVSSTQPVEGDASVATADKKPSNSRRRMIDPTTCERDYSGEELEFMKAVEDYKRSQGRMFPTCSEILEVVRKLGYQKIGRIDIVDADESL